MIIKQSSSGKSDKRFSNLKCPLPEICCYRSREVTP